MIDNKDFIQKTDFLKFEKNINFQRQSDKLRVERHRFDSWRSERVQVPSQIEKRLGEIFPELSDFTTEMTGVANEPTLAYGQPFDLLIETQRAYIATLEKTNAHLQRENDRLRGEVEMLMKFVNAGKGL